MSIVVSKKSESEVTIHFNFNDRSKNITYANFIRRTLMEESLGLGLIGFSWNGEKVGIMGKTSDTVENLIDIIYKVNQLKEEFKVGSVAEGKNKVNYVTLKSVSGELKSPQGNILANCLTPVKLELAFTFNNGNVSEEDNQALLPPKFYAIGSYHVPFTKIQYVEIEPASEKTNSSLIIKGYNAYQNVEKLFEHMSKLFSSLIRKEVM